MDLQRILIPVVALVIAGAAAFTARSWIEAKHHEVTAIAAPAPEVHFKEVLVAAVELAPGSFISASSFRWQKWPDVDVPETYLVNGTNDPLELEGAVARRIIREGDPILTGAVVKPGDRGFLAAVLDPDMRAVSVPVDEASSNAGLILPGDHVDLILTQTLTQENGTGRHVSETVLRDVRVIAMGRSLEGSSGTLGDAAQRQARTTTLEVTPSEAEKVALVTEIGKLSLSLRSLATATPKPSSQDVAQSDVSTFTWDSDVSQVRGATAMTVIRGSTVEALDLLDGEQP